MRASFSEWVTRPRQILVLFSITLAVAAISASNKIHQCHANKGKHLGKQRFQMDHRRVEDVLEPEPTVLLDKATLKQKASEVRAAALGNHQVLTGKEATLVNEVSDELFEKASEEDMEDELAEEVGMQDPASPGSEEGSKISFFHPQLTVGVDKEGAEEPEEVLDDTDGWNNDNDGNGVESAANPVVVEAAVGYAHGSHTIETSNPAPASTKEAPKPSGGFCPAIHLNREDGSCDRDGVPDTLHKHFKGAFKGELILTSTSLKDKTVLAVSSPGKSRKTKLTDVSSHLLDLLPKHDATFGKNFSKCAVIGSSGILLKYQHGKEIDTHDMVLRFNSAKTKGFEKHVGGKTTHRLTNSRNFGFRESKSENVLVHLRTPGAMKALVQRLNHKTRSVLYGLNPQWYSYMDKNLNFLSTSGLNGILMALHRCESVRLYGFHVHPRHGVPYHYYNVKDKPANVGRDDNEWLVVKHLIENNYVELGEPCILECNENGSECQKCINDNQ